MSWTQERVERLTKLWQEGLSASQIAADLGGVTRNAVIGKVHRLGMSNRDKPAGSGTKKTAGSEKAATSARRKTSERKGNSQGGSPSPSPAYARSTQRTTATASVGNAALKMEVEQEEVIEVAVVEKAAEDVVVPISRQLDLMQLTESTCKWPTGDPTLPGFSFCGHQTAEDKPYCEHHSKIAFQPPSERRRRR